MIVVICICICILLGVCEGGLSSSYVRKSEVSSDMPLGTDVFRLPLGYNAPQQVHITQGDDEGRGVIISWTTPDEVGSNSVLYWPANTHLKNTANGEAVTYKFCNYTPGYIHHCTINNLEFDTKYYYVVGSGNVTRKFWFITPPQPGPDVPYTFGVIGDLGQTYNSNETVSHYEMNPAKGEAVLYVGDLSYADRYPCQDNTRWATFVERNAAYQPWIWTAGNHELSYGETTAFKPFLHRFWTPYKASGSISPLWYSIKRASAYITIGDGGNQEGLATEMTQPQPKAWNFRHKESESRLLWVASQSGRGCRGSRLFMVPQSLLEGPVLITVDTLQV